jgi:hypothetical protein
MCLDWFPAPALSTATPGAHHCPSLLWPIIGPSTSCWNGIWWGWSAHQLAYQRHESAPASEASLIVIVKQAVYIGIRVTWTITTSVISPYEPLSEMLIIRPCMATPGFGIMALQRRILAFAFTRRIPACALSPATPTSCAFTASDSNTPYTPLFIMFTNGPTVWWTPGFSMAITRRLLALMLFPVVRITYEDSLLWLLVLIQSYQKVDRRLHGVAKSWHHGQTRTILASSYNHHVLFCLIVYDMQINFLAN